MSPGDTGLDVYDTAYGRVGLAICCEWGYGSVGGP